MNGDDATRMHEGASLRALEKHDCTYCHCYCLYHTELVSMESMIVSAGDHSIVLVVHILTRSVRGSFCNSMSRNLKRECQDSPGTSASNSVGGSGFR
jgi:hypothetical protein